MLKEKAVRKDTRVLSPNVRAAADAQRKRTLLTVSGISPGKLVTVTPAQFGKLDVDPAYQRGETTMVDEIINVVQAGGAILDPVTICKRTSWHDKETLWVVDGHQRVCAFQQLQQSFQAMVHESESLDSEKKFFLALNMRKAVGSDVIVKSWTGPSGRMIVAAHESTTHPLCGRVNFAQGFNESRLGATVIVRGAFTAATGLAATGSTQKILSRFDVAMSPPEKKKKAEQYLRLIGEVFPKGSVSVLVATALGMVAHERWKMGHAYPSSQIVDRLRRVNWRQEIPVLSVKFRPVLIEIINKKWKLPE